MFLPLHRERVFQKAEQRQRHYRALYEDTQKALKEQSFSERYARARHIVQHLSGKARIGEPCLLVDRSSSEKIAAGVTSHNFATGELSASILICNWHLDLAMEKQRYFKAVVGHELYHIRQATLKKPTISMRLNARGVDIYDLNYRDIIGPATAVIEPKSSTVQGYAAAIGRAFFELAVDIVAPFVGSAVYPPFTLARRLVERCLNHKEEYAADRFSTLLNGGYEHMAGYLSYRNKLLEGDWTKSSQTHPSNNKRIRRLEKLKDSIENAHESANLRVL